MTEMNAERTPCCDHCGGATVTVGKLSKLGSHPLVHVFKCKPCRQIISITSDPWVSGVGARPDE